MAIKTLLERNPLALEKLREFILEKINEDQKDFSEDFNAFKNSWLELQLSTERLARSIERDSSVLFAFFDRYGIHVHIYPKLSKDSKITLKSEVLDKNLATVFEGDKEYEKRVDAHLSVVMPAFDILESYLRKEKK